MSKMEDIKTRIAVRVFYFKALGLLRPERPENEESRTGERVRVLNDWKVGNNNKETLNIDR